MRVFAQIQDDRLHWKFESEERPEFAPGFQVIEITGAKPMPEEGWIWNGTVFVESVRSTAEMAAIALQERDRLLDLSARRIAPLQYAVDAGGATVSEVDALRLWKQFVIDVNRVPQQLTFPENIAWPLQPQEVE